VFCEVTFFTPRDKVSIKVCWSNCILFQNGPSEPLFISYNSLTKHQTGKKNFKYEPRLRTTSFCTFHSMAAIVTYIICISVTKVKTDNLLSRKEGRSRHSSYISKKSRDSKGANVRQQNSI